MVADNGTMVVANGTSNGTHGTNGEHVARLGSLEGDDAELVIALITYFPCFIGMFLFAFVGQRLVKNNYYRKWELAGLGPTPPSTEFGWIPVALRFTNDEIFEHAGLDSLIFLEFIRMLLRILGWFSLYACASIAFTAYSTSTSGVESQPLGRIARLSMANLLTIDDTAGPLVDRWLALWASVVGIWLLSGLTIWQMRNSWQRVLQWRKNAWREQREQASALAVCIHSLDRRDKAQLSREHTLGFWRRLYGDEIYDVRMVRPTGNIKSLLSEHASLLKKREATGYFALKGTKLDRNLEQAEEVRNKLSSEYSKYCGPEGDRGSSYFILCKTHRAANAIKQLESFPDQLANVWTLAAPPVQQVIWHGLNQASNKCMEFSAIMSWVEYIALFCFWTVPTAFVGTLMSLENLRTNISWVPALLDSLGPAVESLLGTVLANLSLTIFNGMLPTLCLMLSKRGLHVSEGEVELNAFNNLFLFQFFYTFLGVSTSGTILQMLSDTVNSSWSHVLQVFGSSLAHTSTFFMTYLLLQSCITLPMEQLARLVELGKQLILGAPEAPEHVLWHSIWSKVMLVAAIGMGFASIAPLTVLFALFYLLLAYLFYTRSLVFSYINHAESHGLFWPAATQNLTIGLVAAQLICAGVHFAKQAWITMPFVLLTPPLTLFAVRSQHATWKSQLSVLSMSECLEIDGQYLESDYGTNVDGVGSDEDGARVKGSPKFADWTPEQDAAFILGDVPHVQVAKPPTYYDELFGDAYRQPELTEVEEFMVKWANGDTVGLIDAASSPPAQPPLGTESAGSIYGSSI